MSTSRAGRGTLKRLAPSTNTSKKRRGCPSELEEEGRKEEADGVGVGDDERVATVEGFTGLGRAACVALLTRAGGNVDAAVNAHFVTLSPPPKKKQKSEGGGLPVNEVPGVDLKHRKPSPTQRTLGFAALTPAAAAQALAAAAAAAAERPPPPPPSEPPLFRPPPLAPRRHVAIASCGERWRRVVPNGREASASASALEVTDTAHGSNHAAATAATSTAVAEFVAPASTDPFTAPLRGRAMRACAAPPLPGTCISLEREADNRMDPRAIRCLLPSATSPAADAASRFLGYLPRSVSCHLSPWMDSGALTVSGCIAASSSSAAATAGGGGEGGGGGGGGGILEVTTTTTTTTDEAKTGTDGRQDETDDVTVQLIVTITPAAAADDDERGGTACAWAAAAAAAAHEDAAGGGARLAELTRTRMWLAVNQVRNSSDAALLTRNETAALDALQELVHAAQSLAVRLLQRKNGWIRTPALEGRHREVPDAAAAAAALHAAGLVRGADEHRIVVAPRGGGGGGGSGSGRGGHGGCLHGEDEEEEEEDLRGRLGALTREELGEVALAVGKPKKGSRLVVTAALLAAPREHVLAAWRFALNGGGHEKGSVLGGALRLDPDLVSAVRVVMFLTFLDFSLSNLQSLVFQEIGVVRFPRREGEGGNANVDDGGDDAEGRVRVESGDRAAPPVFPSRAALDEYTAAAEAAGEVDAALEPTAANRAGDEAKALRLLAPVLAPFLEAGGTGQDEGDGDGGGGGGVFARFSVKWIFAQIATVGVGLLERNGKRYEDANRILFALLSGCAAPNRRGGWYIRAATNLGHQGRDNDALQVCEAGLADTWVRSGDRLGLQRRALRLAKKCKRWDVTGAAWRGDAKWEAPLERVGGVALNEKVAEKNRYQRPQAAAAVEGGSLRDDVIVIDDGNHVTGGGSTKNDADTKLAVVLEDAATTVSVEELALAHYASAAGGGWRGVHSEVGLYKLHPVAPYSLKAPGFNP
jgi:hypothetical protein